MSAKDWIILVGLLSAVVSVQFLLMAILVGKLADEMEKVKCRTEVSLKLLTDWSPQMRHMSMLSEFIREFITRLQDESSIHSNIPVVFEPTISELVQVRELEDLYGAGPEQEEPDA